MKTFSLEPTQKAHAESCFARLMALLDFVFHASFDFRYELMNLRTEFGVLQINFTFFRPYRLFDGSA